MSIGNAGKERVLERNLKENQSLGTNRSIPRSNKLNKTFKFNIYKTTIRTIFACALETVVLNKLEEEKLKKFGRKIMRTILGSNHHKTKKNKTKYDIGQENITKHIKARKDWN